MGSGLCDGRARSLPAVREDTVAVGLAQDRGGAVRVEAYLGWVINVICAPPAVTEVIGAHGLIDDIFWERFATAGCLCGAAGGVADRRGVVDGDRP